MKHSLWVVLGTGTEIGKTTVSCALLAAARDAARPRLGLKPVETGVEAGQLGADAHALALASGLPHPETPFTFSDPVSPHLAAGRESRPIVLSDVVRWTLAHSTLPTLVETAGGAFSPLGYSSTNASLAAALAPTGVLLVCPDRLGALHDATATLIALGSNVPALPRPVVVLNALTEHAGRHLDNAEMLAGVHGVEVFRFPHEGSSTAASSLFGYLDAHEHLGH